MKNLKYTLLLSLVLFCTGCLNDDFLEKKPEDKLLEEYLFTEDKNFEVYSWSLYDFLPGYSISGLYSPAEKADDMFIGLAGQESDYAWQKVKVPTSDGGWKYDKIRAINVMLDALDRPNQLNQAEKDHWRSIGYFFRSMEYFKLVARFGDVIWIDHVLTDVSPELHAPRAPRDTVMNHIYEDLVFAEEHVQSRAANTVNQDVVRALMSRIFLFEGTWKKYHGTSESDSRLSRKYLDECVRVSSELVKKFPDIHPSYDELFNSDDLSGVPGILLYKVYDRSVVGHSMVRQVMGSNASYELTKDAVDSYLCTDGRPIYMQDGYPQIEQDPFTEFKNRDYRLLLTVEPPYKVKPSKNLMKWEHESNPMYSEFFPIMEKISKEGFKALPFHQGANKVVSIVPHFKLHTGGTSFQSCQGGYFANKYYNNNQPHPLPPSGCSNDFPIFRMGEVMLNYAEAAFETGILTQEIIDRTINKLRTRGGVAPMDLSNVVDDPRRDDDVPPALWEIRRERRVELMIEGNRFNDIRRWKKGEYVNKQKLGRWHSVDLLLRDKLIKKASENKIRFTEGDKGYIVYYGDPVKEGYGWLEHYYLDPLPLDELTMNENLTQNPGWPE